MLRFNKMTAAIAVSLLALTGCQSMSNVMDKMGQQKQDPIHHTASHYGNTRTLTFDGTSYPIDETSARILVDESGNHLKLVDDIFDGHGEKAVPGYKMMLINRTSSFASMARQTPENQIVDNRRVHRGSRLLVGIPVENGVPKLDDAQIVSFEVILDDPNAPAPEEGAMRPRGKKATKNVTIANKKIAIKSLTFPNFASGEAAGGGVEYTASATVDGKAVEISTNSAFTIFYTAKPDNAKGFDKFN